MKVGVLRIQLRLYGPTSLKEKRSLLKHLIAQLKRKFNISVAEVDHQNDHRIATLGIAYVGNERPFVNRVLSKVAGEVARATTCEVESTHIEIW